MSPRVSVIIPAYNARESILEALDSVIGQTFEDWEAIVADDGSTDDTAELIAAYHPRIRCVRGGRNRGIGAARNLALANASGELVALLDADDLWRPQYLERQIVHYEEAVAAGQDVGIVCCGVILQGPEGPRGCTYPETSFTLAALLRHNRIFVSSLVPRKLIEQLGGFATDCLGTEDYDMWLRIVESGRAVVAVREPLAVYRMGPGTVSTNAAGMARAMQATYRHALERGRLTARERAIARSELRWQRLIELGAEAARQRMQTGRLPVGGLLRAAPLGMLVALGRPALWVQAPRLFMVSLRGVRGARARLPAG